MSRVISLEITNKAGKEPNNLYGIIFNNNQIEKFLFVPSDYKVEEFANIACKEYYKPYNTTIIFDKNGIGIVLDDYFKLNNIKNTINPSRLELAMRWSKAKKYALTLAMDSHFDEIGKIEFNKMLEELDNFEVKQSPVGNLELTIIDREKSISRALCYLQYLYLVS